MNFSAQELLTALGCNLIGSRYYGTDDMYSDYDWLAPINIREILINLGFKANNAAIEAYGCDVLQHENHHVLCPASASVHEQYWQFAQRFKRFIHEFPVWVKHYNTLRQILDPEQFRLVKRLIDKPAFFLFPDTKSAYPHLWVGGFFFVLIFKID